MTRKEHSGAYAKTNYDEEYGDYDSQEELQGSHVGDYQHPQPRQEYVPVASHNIVSFNYNVYGNVVGLDSRNNPAVYDPNTQQWYLIQTVYDGGKNKPENVKLNLILKNILV